MVWRPRNNRLKYKSEIFGNPKLTLAHFIVFIEKILSVFARPLLIAGAFIACSWLGLFTGLYPWAHLVTLIFFTVVFFDALGKAKNVWVPLSPASGRRRLEESSHLAHRPFDVLEDRPAVLDEESAILWQEHLTQARHQLQGLRWPKWMLNLSDRDPYAFRHGMLIVLVLAAVVGWGSLGARLIEAINPALGKMHAFSPTLDAWITPPEYTGLPPIMIATPAGLRLTHQVINVPVGSLITAHLMEKDGRTPQLSINNEDVEFTNDEHGDFQVSDTLRDGSSITIRRGWQEIGTWRVHLVQDQPPKVAFDQAPSVSERKSVRFAYSASDDYGVTSVTAEITPRESLPGASSEPLHVALTSARAKELHRVDYEDLTANAWSGLPVDIKLIAKDAAGHEAVSESKTITLPERDFFNPVAQALIEERKKLLISPYDDATRNEVANVMANVAQRPGSYHGDPLVLMALRSGAVRLVLSHNEDVVSPISDILWQAALRIEDGSVGVAEQDLRQAQKELADALDRGASEAEINERIDRLHQALGRYLAELSTRMAARPGPIEDLGALMGDKTNALTPQDLEQMLEKMRDLSAGGQREEALQELSKLQQLLENLRTGPQELTDKQKADVQALKALHAMAKTQKDLIDRTFQHAQVHTMNDPAQLATEQNDLKKRLEEFLAGLKEGDKGDLEEGDEAMKDAVDNLRQGSSRRALEGQGEALRTLENAEKSRADSLRQSMMMFSAGGLPREGYNDGKPDMNGNGTPEDSHTVKVPDHLQAQRVREILDELQRRAGDLSRPKIEHDYIDRLLQNF